MAVDHAIGLNAKDSAGDDFITKEHAQRMHRTNELLFFGAPMHKTRNRQSFQSVSKKFRHERCGIPAFAQCFYIKPFAFGGFKSLSLRDADPVGLGPAGCGFGRIAVFVEGCFKRRPADLQFGVLLFGVEIFDHQSQAARCRVPLGGRESQTEIFQGFYETVVQRLSQSP